jgi:SAM-dependent methyltransferase
VDLAEGMLALARADGLAVARMDIERLGLATGAFDAAACGHALQFCADVRRALAEVRRVLRPGARFAASLPAAGGSSEAGRLLEQVLDRRLPRAPRMGLHDQARVRAAVASTGFRRVTVERVEELATYAGPEELVERTLRWWTCAWRLEGMPETTRDELHSEAVAALRAGVGDGPLALPGATWVLSAER